MKKIIAVLLAMVIMLALTPLTVLAEDIASGVCGEGVTWTVETTFVSNADKLTISGTGSMNDFTESAGPPWEAYADRIKTVIIESGVDRIGAYAFSHCSDLDYVIFQGDTPPEIAEKAFLEGGGEGIIVYPEGQGGAYADIVTNAGVPDTWVAREPGHTEAVPITGVKIPVAGEPADTLSISSDSYDYYIAAMWWDPGDPLREFDGEYEKGDDYYLIIELRNDLDYSGIPGAVIDYKNGLLPLDGFTVYGQRAELFLGSGPFELSSREDLKIMVVFRNTADFVPVTAIRDVPLGAAVGHEHTLSGTVVPDNATYKDIVWSIKDDGGTGAVLAGDGKTITGLASVGTVTVTATVPRGGERSPDPEYPDDPPAYWPYQDYTQDFEITVTAPAALSIEGPANMSLTEGYAATATEPFTITGSPAPTVSVSGDSHITWNNTDKKLEIAAGLTPGDYPVTLTASNGIGSNAVFTFTLTVTAPAIVNAGPPTITRQPQSAAVTTGTAHTLTVEATSPDGGTLSYQWYENSTASNSGGTAIDGAVGASYTPPTSNAGNSYYYVVVTNTNNSVSGNKTAAATSGACTLTVTPPGTPTVKGEIKYEDDDLMDHPPGSITVTLHLERNGVDAPYPETKVTLNMTNVGSTDVSYYTFTNVENGWYTVVADNEDYIITRHVRVMNGEVVEPPERIIFTPGNKQTLVSIDPNIRVHNVSTNDLPDLFNSATDYRDPVKPAYSADDEAFIADGGTVEIKLDVKNVADTTALSALNNAIARAGLFTVATVDLDLIKTRTPENGLSETPVVLSDVHPAVLEIAVPMPDEPGVRQKVITGVYRVHGGSLEALGNGESNKNGDGEYFELGDYGYTVILHVNKFSAYAFAETVVTGGGGNGEGGNGGGNSDVPASGLYLNKDELPLDVGESETLIATVFPSGATNKGVTWTSSDPSVAMVDANGKITAIKPGTAIITARSNSGGYTDFCAITVTNAAVPPTETHNPDAGAADYPDVPQTGDNGNAGWGTILLIAPVLGIAGIVAWRKKQTGKGT